MKTIESARAQDREVSWLVEEADVVALFSGGGWIETRRKAGCEGCSARSGCGNAVLSRWRRPPRLALYTDELLQVGDSVKVGIPSGNFLKATMALYGIPLATAIFAGGMAEWLTVAGHGSVPLAFAGGLMLGVLLSRYLLRRHQRYYRPRLLSVGPSS